MTGIDWREATEQQLAKWGLHYHRLVFGKPAADYYIDDRMLPMAEIDRFCALPSQEGRVTRESPGRQATHRRSVVHVEYRRFLALAHRARQRDDPLQDLALDDDVERGRRLVHDDEPGLEGEGESDESQRDGQQIDRALSQAGNGFCCCFGGF